MNVREAFSEALERYVFFKGLNAAQELHRFCGLIRNDSAEMPLDDWHNVRRAIDDCSKADDWEAKGRTYAGAAQRIRPTLKID